MKFAVFFRNLNLGRPPAPTRQQFEAAFADAGAEQVASFQTNGSLVFAARSVAQARQLLRAASQRLHLSNGFQEPAFLRKVGDLLRLTASEPFRRVKSDSVYDCYITFLPESFSIPDSAPRRNTRGDVKVIAYHDHEMLSVAYQLNRSHGNASAFVEREFGVPCTTRTWGTLLRLLEKHG